MKVAHIARSGVARGSGVTRPMRARGLRLVVSSQVRGESELEVSAMKFNVPKQVRNCGLLGSV